MITVQRREPPVHGRIGREPGLQGVNVGRQIPKALLNGVKPRERPKERDMRGPDVGWNKDGLWAALQRDLQQITAVQAENRPPVRVEVADGLQTPGELLRLLQSGQKNQAVDLTRPAVLLINGTDLPGHHKAGRRPCRSRVLHAAAGAQGIDTISAQLQRLCQLSPPSGVGKVPRPYEIDALASGPEIQVGGVAIPAGSPGILGVNMQIRDKHGVPPFRRFSPSYLFQSRRARLLFSLPLFLLALETILW